MVFGGTLQFTHFVDLHFLSLKCLFYYYIHTILASVFFANILISIVVRKEITVNRDGNRKK